MKKIILFSLSFLLINKVAFTQESTESKGKKEKKLEMTRAEFNQAVTKEVEKIMKRVGQGKIIDFSKELLKKEEVLKLQELELKKKAEAVTLSEKNLEKRVKDFQGHQNKFLACLNGVDEKANKRITHMVDVISGMRPVNAADVLSVQDPEIAVKILGMLEAVKVSKIFNFMKKEISARLQKQYMTMKK